MAPDLVICAVGAKALASLLRDNHVVLLRDRDESVELSIVGYQFENATGEWDRNWLAIAGHVRLAGHEWQFRDPCLTTWEAEALAEWLRVASATQPDDASMSFTEPNLRFGMRGFSSELVTVRVSFELEARPPELRDVPWDACFADLTMLRSDLARADIVDTPPSVAIASPSTRP